MPNDSAVALIAPHIAGDLARAREVGATRPLLERLAGRGMLQVLRSHADLEPWRVGLLEALGLAAAVAQYPEAAVMSAACGDDARAYWLRATPMHFAAGLNDLAASPLIGAHALAAADRAELAGAIAAHLQSAGFELHAGEEWLLRSDRALDVATSSPAIAAVALQPAMPRGRDSGALRRLMTELQMLLHEHPVNLRRARAGAPEANAIWLHGAGRATCSASCNFPAAFGSEQYLRGLYRLHEQTVQPPLDSASALLERTPARALVATETDSLEELEAQWLEPLVNALRTGRIGVLELILDRWRMLLTRAALIKFWRRPLALEKWPT